MEDILFKSFFVVLGVTVFLLSFSKRTQRFQDANKKKEQKSEKRE